MKYKICLLLSVLYLAVETTLSAQITSSPYSIFGLGSTEGTGSGISNAMGGTGIAFLSGQNINLLNPASTGDMDSLLSVFEIGFAGKYTTYTTAKKTQSLFDANFRSLAMAFRISKRWAVSTGITPYSAIGYNINVMSPIEGTTQEYRKTFTGEGGVNRVFIGNSFRVTDNLFLGVNAAYLFGTITHSESSDDYKYTLQNKVYISNLDLDYGLNYRVRIRDWSWNLGLIYNNGKTLQTQKQTSLYTTSAAETTKTSVSELKVPKSYGFGIAFQKRYFRGGIDYETRLWKSIQFTNPLLKSRNSNRYSFGLDIPSGGNRNGTGRMLFYRLGAQYCESYMVIDGHPINYRSVSLGTGIPVKGYLSVINMSVELGQNGTAKGGLFAESFCTIHLNLSLKDLWFIKRKYM
jgi:hypothetical protein